MRLRGFHENVAEFRKFYANVAALQRERWAGRGTACDPARRQIEFEVDGTRDKNAIFADIKQRLGAAARA